MSTAAEIVQISGKMGIKGVSRVRCRALEGRDQNKVMTRNVIGPVKVGDIILLKETIMDSVSKLEKR
jgi:small subunit ribosomal protein S28e